WITPQRFTPMTHSQSWWVADSRPPCTVTPALLHSTWTAPHCLNARSARVCTSARRLTSVLTVMASLPASFTAVTVPSIPASSTSATTTRAPARARPRHSSRPIPLAPPVTTATLSRTLSMAPPVTSTRCARRWRVWRQGREMSSVSARARWYPGEDDRPSRPDSTRSAPGGQVMEYRLPTTVVPARYDIRLEPDLDAATFTG